MNFDAPRVLAVVYERKNFWFRHLKARLKSRDVVWRESRTIDDVLKSIFGVSVPLIFFARERTPVDFAEELARIRLAASDAIVVAIRKVEPDESTLWPLEFGATEIVRSETPPPFVAELLERRVELARSRIKRSGFGVDPSPPLDERSALRSLIDDVKNPAAIDAFLDPMIKRSFDNHA
jgi:hypothetical protein